MSTSDLYEYDKEHVGRKTYVGVLGHTQMVPKHKTYRGADGRNHLRPEYGGNWDALPNQSAYFIPDKAGYQSPMDGNYVEGRSAHREHMRTHNVIEVGDQPVGTSRRDYAPMPSVGQDIARTIQELSSR